MSEFIEACTQSPVNLALTVLLVLIVLYWLVVIVGAIGIDSLDFDLDFDGEPDIEIDLDVDGDDTAGILEAGLATAFLRFFHIGTVPILVLLSVFVLSLWAIGVLSYPWIGNWGMVLQIGMLVPFAVLGLFITKLITLPLKVLFARMQEQELAEQNINLIGRRCNVVSLTADYRHGQVEVPTEGAPLRLNAITNDESVVLNKGDEAVLVSKDGDRGVYTIRAF